MKREERFKGWVCLGSDCPSPCIALQHSKPGKDLCPYGDGYYVKAFRTVSNFLEESA